MTGRFIATPEVPDGVAQDWQAALLSSLKENVELLTGTRGEVDSISTSVVRGDITVQPVGTQTMVKLSATGAGFTISGSDVASLADYTKALNDLQELANDLFRTRQALDTLILQLKGG